MMKHCRSDALAANRCYRQVQARCAGAAPTAHPACFTLKDKDLHPPRLVKHGPVWMQPSATREPANPRDSFRATRLHHIRLCQNCNSRRETVVCPLFLYVVLHSIYVAASAYWYCATGRL